MALYLEFKSKNAATGEHNESCIHMGEKIPNFENEEIKLIQADGDAKTPIQLWLEYFNCKDTREVGKIPKFRKILEDFEGLNESTKYYFSGSYLNIINHDSICVFVLQGNPVCLKTVIVHKI